MYVFLRFYMNCPRFYVDVCYFLSECSYIFQIFLCYLFGFYLFYYSFLEILFVFIYKYMNICMFSLIEFHGSRTLPPWAVPPGHFPPGQFPPWHFPPDVDPACSSLRSRQDWGLQSEQVRVYGIFRAKPDNGVSMYTFHGGKCPGGKCPGRKAPEGTARG